MKAVKKKKKSENTSLNERLRNKWRHSRYDEASDDDMDGSMVKRTTAADRKTKVRREGGDGRVMGGNYRHASLIHPKKME